LPIPFARSLHSSLPFFPYLCLLFLPPPTCYHSNPDAISLRSFPISPPGYWRVLPCFCVFPSRFFEAPVEPPTTTCGFFLQLPTFYLLTNPLLPFPTSPPQSRPTIRDLPFPPFAAYISQQHFFLPPVLSIHITKARQQDSSSHVLAANESPFFFSLSF